MTINSLFTRSKSIFNLKTKVILIFLVLVLIPLAIIGTFSIKATEGLIFDMVMRQLENVAVDKTTILERWIEERKADLLVVSETSVVKSMYPDLMAPYLNLVREKHLVYKIITVISLNGDIIYSTDKMEGMENIKEIWNHPLTDRLYLSDIIYDEKENESVFSIFTPVLDDAFTITGAVCGTIGTSQIIFSILNVSIGETGECYLVDRKGRFLAHKEPSRILSENISRTESFENIFTPENRKQTYLDYRGIEVLGTSKKIAGTDWYLVVEQDRDEAFHSLDILKLITFLTILLCMASAFMLIWIISSHIVDPIRALSQSADILANSEFEKAVVKIDRRDEIGMLYYAFENMSRRLQERQDNLAMEVNLKEAELKETDNILRQTKLIAERSEKYAAIGRLGAAVAHEIRTPLTSLKLFLESVLLEIELSPGYQEDLAIAMKEIKRIEATINRFLDFSKPQELIISDIDISSLIEDILSIIKPMINKNECTLWVEIEGGLQTVKGDKKLLGEALINILVNSLDVMPRQGSVSVTVKKDSIDLDNGPQPCIRIDISDTGSGISEDQVAHIFEPFFTTKSSGTGLGLSIAAKTVKSHGGFIRVKSVINQGTAFSIFLPFEFNGDMFLANG